MDPEDWTFLLTGGLGDSGAIPNPATDWLQERTWKELGRLAQMPGFKVYKLLHTSPHLMSVLNLCLDSAVPAGQGLLMAQAIEALSRGPLLPVLFLHSGRDHFDLVLRVV